jgi:predicted enzyme related to lactoylglutathione lyase
MTACPVVWFHVTGADGGALRKFYAELFDWSITFEPKSQFGFVEAACGGIPGTVGPGENGQSQVAFYVAVPDLYAALDRAHALGGGVVAPPMTVADGAAEIAFLSDPEGNVIGLSRAREAAAAREAQG